MDIENLARVGLMSKYFAEEKPDRIAVRDASSSRTFLELHQNANRLVHALYALGLQAGDAIAILTSNRCEFVEVVLASLRSGLRLTPVNWHLSKTEADYIIADCEAKAVFVESRFLNQDWISSSHGDRYYISIGATETNALDYHSWIAEYTADEIDFPEHGTFLMYTSGTTGKPKGVLRRAPDIMQPQWEETFCDYAHETDVQLCCGPVYHAAPLYFDIRWPLVSGAEIILLDKWDSEGVLDLIQTHQVTHLHMVPIMFQRLLALPEAVRAKYDVSSLKRVIHGAAPCPRETKRQMIDWFGPVIFEYYSGSEGGAGIVISSEEWMAKPGSVGRIEDPNILKIVDENGERVGPDEEGEILHKVDDQNPFEYFKAPEKTAKQHKGGYFTLGDIGRIDEDGYLFLTGRSAECIISGGVNIYPSEIDQVLSGHPAVADVCTIGIPNKEWGEEVRSVVQLAPDAEASDDLKASILTFASENLSKFKCPRSIDFVDELPRLPSGKIPREKVRAPYWEQAESKI
ncbi:MAG: AMP-binding protein [Pseudomonadota bacterium]